MLLPSQKPSSSYSLSKLVYVTSQQRHPSVVHPLRRNILDLPMSKLRKMGTNYNNTVKPVLGGHRIKRTPLLSGQ